MKNLLLIIALISTQCACAGQSQRATSADVLLSFGELANEITVGFEDFNTESRTYPEAQSPTRLP
jgi:hypothetical protein